MFYTSIQDYLSKVNDFYQLDDVNFNPNDGITAEVVYNIEDLDYFDFDYLLVINENNNIESRWFIMDARRNLSGQFTITLRRDVVAETFNTNFRFNAPIYVEKGTLPDNDPFIVNSENFVVNQIKKEEILLKDNSNMGWIVGYFANNGSTGEITTKPKAAPTNYTTVSNIASNTGISESKLTQMFTGTIPFAVSDLSFVFGITSSDSIFPSKMEILVDNHLRNTSWNVFTAYAWNHAIGNTEILRNTVVADNGRTYFENSNYATLKAALTAVINNQIPGEEYLTQFELNKLMAYQGQIVLISGRYYKINIINQGNSNHNEVIINENENTYFDNFTTALDLDSYYPDWEIYLNYQVANIQIDLSEQSTVGYKASIPASHNTLIDAPYSMFIIPFTDEDYDFITSGTHQGIKKEDALNVAFEIATALDAALYDLQLLPYCPEYETIFNDQNDIDMRGTSTLENQYYSIIKDGDGVEKGLILFPRTSTFSLTIYQTLNLHHSRKIESNVDFYRLCSPNYNGVFEFNLAKDGGSVSYFEVDCTYKPYTPFIRVTPEFNFLYGSNFKDGRGLICGGDFTLPIIKEAWAGYQVQNKNFATIFSREIQNLEFNQSQERFKEAFSAGAGVIGSSAGGAMLGAKAGPWGAAAGAVVGAGAGIAGGAIDISMAEARRAEVKDYALDRFNLSLGNIRALPNSLSRVSSIVATNKVFPFIEYYTCTDEEIEAFENKIKYDGMTVGRIDYLSNFINSDTLQYFKGSLIRAVDIEEDNHFVETLYNEIAKGVYI